MVLRKQYPPWLLYSIQNQVVITHSQLVYETGDDIFYRNENVNTFKYINVHQLSVS